jgi:hypothetical protein
MGRCPTILRCHCMSASASQPSQNSEQDRRTSWGSRGEFFLYKPIDKDRLLNSFMPRREPWRTIGDEAHFIAVQSSSSVWCARAGSAERRHQTQRHIGQVGSYISAGSSVFMRMHLSERMRPVAGEGSVVRIAGGNRMGIHFDRLAPEEAERLQEFLLPLTAGT